MKKLPILLAASVLSISSVANAGDWKSEGEVGATISSGNTENNNLSAKLKLTNEVGAWKHEVGFLVLNNKDNNNRSAERYLITGKSARDFNDRYYGFISGKYDKDLFSGFERQASVAAGLGYHAIKTDKVTLDLEAGLGYRLSKTTAGVDSNETIIRGGLFYKNKLNENTEFIQNLTTEIGSDNTLTESETALKVKINDKMGVKLSLNIKNNSDVPTGTEKTDTVSAVGITYGF